MDLIYSGVVFVLSEVPCLYLVMTLLTLAYCTFVHFQLHLSGSLLLLSWSCSRLDTQATATRRTNQFYLRRVCIVAETVFTLYVCVHATCKDTQCNTRLGLVWFSWFFN